MPFKDESSRIKEDKVETFSFDTPQVSLKVIIHLRFTLKNGLHPAIVLYQDDMTEIIYFMNE